MLYFPLLIILGSFLGAHANRTVQRRILGGVGAFDEAPWIVALLDPEYYCTGAIIASSWVITVAECIISYETRHIHIKVGITSLEQKGQVYWPSRFITYSNVTHTHDMGLIKTLSEINLSPPCVTAVTLPTHNVQVNDGPMFIAGWGSDGFREVSPCLQILYNMYVIDVDDCHHLLDYPTWFIKKELFCTELQEESFKVGCRRDVGGPLVNMEGQLVGLLTTGNASDCGIEIPDVFVNVFLHIGWVFRKIDEIKRMESRIINRRMNFNNKMSLQ